jgi:hypothetical protein
MTTSPMTVTESKYKMIWTEKGVSKYYLRHFCPDCKLWYPLDVMFCIGKGKKRGCGKPLRTKARRPKFSKLKLMAQKRSNNNGNPNQN